MTRENFFYEEIFMSQIQDLIEYLEFEEIYNLDDDFSVQCEYSSYEKVFSVDKDFVVNAIIQKAEKWQERFPENQDFFFKRIEEAVEKSIDIDKLNDELPALYYGTGKFFTITKQDIIDYITPS